MNSYTFNSFTPLKGSKLILIKLTAEHIIPLSQALLDVDGFFANHRGLKDEKSIQENLAQILELNQKKERLTLVAQLKSDKSMVAMSSYLSPTVNFTGIEIGFTWIAKNFQRTFVNSEMKFLMLQYAFETMNVKRVQFSTDPVNEKSNQAILRLRAKFEGTLRKWRFNSSEDQGDRNIYSILDHEWNKVRLELQKKLFI